MTYRERAYFENEPCGHVADWADARRDARRKADGIAAFERRHRADRRATGQWAAGLIH